MAYDLNQIKAYVANPKAYTDSLYQRDPETYLGVPVYQQFMQSFGREPTQDEFAIFAPYVVSMGHTGAKSYIAQYAKTQNAPVDEQKRLDEKIPQYSGGIQDTFNELLKRGATDAEIQHFGREMASGNLDAYTLQQFVQSMPEYQAGQDKAMREGLSTELQGYDKKFFDTGKEDIISRYAKMGRQGSSSLDYALTDMLGKIADKRGEWLANLSASQYGSNKDTARTDYTTSMNKMLSDEQYNRSQKDALTQRGWNSTDYMKQSQDYMSALKAQEKPWWQYALPGATQAVGQLGAAAIMA